MHCAWPKGGKEVTANEFIWSQYPPLLKNDAHTLDAHADNACMVSQTRTVHRIWCMYVWWDMPCCKCHMYGYGFSTLTCTTLHTTPCIAHVCQSMYNGAHMVWTCNTELHAQDAMFPPVLTWNSHTTYNSVFIPSCVHIVCWLASIHYAHSMQCAACECTESISIHVILTAGNM